jgi:hypothetical protein
MERMKVCAAGMGALDIRGFIFKDDIKAVMTGNTNTFPLHFLCLSPRAPRGTGA